MDYSMLTARQHRALEFLTEVPACDLGLDGRKCSICLEPLLPNTEPMGKLAPEPLVRTGCGHIFGKACVLGWLKYAGTCPYCRTKLPGSAPLDLDQWRTERENIVKKMDAIIRDEPNRRLPSSHMDRYTMTPLEKKQPRWLCASRLKGFLLLETSAYETPAEPMQQVILHFAADPTRMTNYEVCKTMKHWLEYTDFRGLSPEYYWNVDQMLRAVVRDLSIHGVQVRLIYGHGDRFNEAVN